MAVPQHRFAPGDVVAERYEIVRFLAQGGMADVYEARDRALAVDVALKVIRAHLAWDERTLRTLRREVRLARRITHRGVCRLFDIGFHRGRGGSQPFLTMELVRGETLASRLRRLGRLSTREALPIALQVVAALEAAHGAGIAHRDFKPGNVILDGERVVITDFGLARHAAAQGATTRSGLRAGTPAYMAPEQVEGRAPTTASDVYALGVVLFELVTGQKPFPPGLPPEQRLWVDAPSPRLLRPELDAAWERAILRCLARDPHERFTRVAEVGDALRTRPSRHRRLALAVAPLALALLAFPTPRRPEPRRVLELPAPRSLSKEPAPAWEHAALVELLSAVLPAGCGLRLAGPGERGDLTIEARRGEAGGRERLDLRLVGRSGETLQAWAEEVAVGDVARLAAGMAARLSGRAAARGPGELSPAAARRFGDGLLALRAGLPASAAEDLAAAAELAPSHPLVHLALAEARSRIGQPTQALAAARWAIGRSAALPDEPRLLLEARAHELAGLWPRALVARRDLARTYPDDPAHARRLAEALAQAGSGPPRTLSR